MSGIPKTFIVSDEDNFREKLRKVNFSDLQVVTDFDGTCTSAYGDAPGISCHGVIGQYPLLPEDFRKSTAEMAAKYGPLEKNPSLTLHERELLMNAWWGGSHALIIEQRIKIADIQTMVDYWYKQGRFRLRQGCLEFFQKVRDFHIPLIVLSAGISLVIECLFEIEKIPVDDLTVVISNQTIENSDNELIDFVEPVLHGLSKKNVLHQFVTDSVKRRDRNQFLVFGDMPHDIEMVSNIPDKDLVISIGFLAEPKYLEEYKKIYDVVVLDGHKGNHETAPDDVLGGFNVGTWILNEIAAVQKQQS
jgi:cytosolic 5'-nucleotidase 3